MQALEPLLQRHIFLTAGAIAAIHTAAAIGAAAGAATAAARLLTQSPGKHGLDAAHILPLLLQMQPCRRRLPALLLPVLLLLRLALLPLLLQPHCLPSSSS
jgi:hypothetical protein